MSQIDDKYLNLLRSRYRQASKKEKTAAPVGQGLLTAPPLNLKIYLDFSPTY